MIAWHDLHWVLPMRSEALTVVMNGFTALGYLPFFLAFLPIGYWLWDKDMFTRLAVLIMGTALLNAFAKDWFQDPRPDLSFALDQRVEGSYGMPSGHAQVATAMWLWLAYEMRRTWAWCAAILIVIGVSFSRLYLGVHDVEDVVVGVALGLAGMVVFRLLVSEHLSRWHDLHPAAQLGILLAVQPVIWFSWPRADGPGSASAILAFMFGWWAGVLFDRHRMDFKRHPSWRLAIVAAVAGVGLLFMTLGTREKGLLATGLGKTGASWVEMLLIALYTTAIAPALFRLARVGH
jgi:hypothetical protein